MMSFIHSGSEKNLQGFQWQQVELGVASYMTTQAFNKTKNVLKSFDDDAENIYLVF